MLQKKHDPQFRERNDPIFPFHLLDSAAAEAEHWLIKKHGRIVASPADIWSYDLEISSAHRFAKFFEWMLDIPTQIKTAPMGFTTDKFEVGDLVTYTRSEHVGRFGFFNEWESGICSYLIPFERGWEHPHYPVGKVHRVTEIYSPTDEILPGEKVRIENYFRSPENDNVSQRRKAKREWKRRLDAGEVDNIFLCVQTEENRYRGLEVTVDRWWFTPIVPTRDTKINNYESITVEDEVIGQVLEASQFAGYIEQLLEYDRLEGRVAPRDVMVKVAKVGALYA